VASNVHSQHPGLHLILSFYTFSKNFLISGSKPSGAKKEDLPAFGSVKVPLKKAL
jgi:hypothetical protein